MHIQHPLRLSSLFISLLSVPMTTVFAETNFHISPIPPTPTTVTPGSTVNVFYLVTNFTSTTRRDYRIKGLPTTAKQNTCSANYCPDPITLAAGASCTLKLDITGEAKTNFAICKGNSCTTSEQPLNITVIPKPPSHPVIAAGSYLVSKSQYPLLATSLDSGLTWLYTITSASPVLPTVCTNPAGGADILIKLNSSSCGNDQLCIAAGTCAIDVEGNLSPLLATSTDGGTTWDYTITDTQPTMPTGTKSINLVSVSSSGTTCATAGSRVDTSANTHPLLATSTNGSNWVYAMQSSALPSYCPTGGEGNPPAAEFTSTSCSGQICVTVGNCGTADKDPPSFPLIARCINNFSSCSYVALPTTSPAPKDSNQFYVSNSCSGVNCVIAGTYSDIKGSPSAINLPWVASSVDAGASWVYTITGSTPSLPTDCAAGNKGQINVLFKSISCSGNNCSVAGSCLVDGDVQTPLLAYSQTGGVTWAYTITNALLPLPSGATLGELVSTNCAGQDCIAAGSYLDSSKNTLPLVAMSTNGGPWTYTLLGTSPALPSGCTGAQLVTASCDGVGHCVAAGNCTKGTQLLASSSDHGQSWTYTITSSTPTPPTGLVSGNFYSTSFAIP